MIAHFGVRFLTLLAPAPQPELPPPPPPVVAYVGTYEGVEFDAGPAPDMSLMTGSEDGVAVDTGDGVTVTDYTTVDRPVYDDAWLAPLCEAKPVTCYPEDWNR